MGYRRRNDRSTTGQEWIPRGSSTATAMNPPLSFNSNPSGNKGDSNYSSASSGSRHRGGSVRRSYTARPSYPKNEPETLEDVPQLVLEIEDKLAKRAIECMICYEMVGKCARIWSCSCCYSIFHLSCIKKWARVSTSVDSSVEENQGVNWRCPGCQSLQLLTAKEIRYVCFCGKMPNPRRDLNLTPHSCGVPCGKPLEREVAGGVDGNGNGNDHDRCPHLCVLQCHPGPCPPCKAFAPPRRCPCGKKTIKTKCSDRNSELNCRKPCNKLLECGLRHRCKQICHQGPCEPCQVSIKISCFCKKNKTEFLFCKAFVKDQRPIDDVISCNSTCGKKLACGNHYCGKNCHPNSCGDCEFSIKTCYCGKTKIQNERKSCRYPTPRCSQICGKLLPCGFHYCSKSCHPGSCGDCELSIKTCYCGKTKIQNERKSCRYPIPRCSQICGKPLPCGLFHIHYCKELCHSGNCPPCLVQVNRNCHCSSSSSSSSSSWTVECYRRRGVEFFCDKDCRLEKNLERHSSLGRITARVHCDAGGSGRIDTVSEASVKQNLPVPLQPVEATDKKVPGQRKFVIAITVFVVWCFLSKLLGDLQPG